MTPSDSPLRRILVCGSGLAAIMTVAALCRQAPARFEIVWLRPSASEPSDAFYGGVTTPSAYDLHLRLGLDEAALVLNSDAAFCLGARYVNWGWGQDRHTWTQAYHTPFPVLNGVVFYHYLVQRGIDTLSPFLISSIAAENGVFAHPPEDERHPLSRAEYGYQFDAASYGVLFERLIGARATRVSGSVAAIERAGDVISALRLEDGRTLGGDLFIDCTGPQARLADADALTSQRRLRWMSGRWPRQGLGSSARLVTAAAFGWSALTCVQGADLKLTVYAAEDEDQARQAHGQILDHGEIALGHRAAAWRGNCVAIGHAAGVVEPVTAAPMLLLQRDIKRLLDLLPLSNDMMVERREFNRQFRDDYRHAELFNRALFKGVAPDAPPYWRDAVATPVDERLAAKIAQFESRGLHIAYDLEPFTAEDWVIQHFGMGRRPERYDRIADQTPPEQINGFLGGLRGQIAQVTKAMPPHGVYRDGLTAFLRRQQGDDI